MKKKVTYLLKYICITIVLFVLYLICVTIAPKYQTTSMWANLESSASFMYDEGLYSSPFANGNLFDNWTDSYYLSIIYLQGRTGNSLLDEGLSNYICANKSDETVVDAMYNAIVGKENYEIKPYSNYWLGIILPLKILLSFFSLAELRYILYVVSVILHSVVLYQLYKNGDIGLAAAYAFACVLFCVNYQASCLASSVDFLIEPITMIYFVKHRKEGINPYFYFLIGSLQVYLSFLYAPIRVVAMLLVFSVVLNGKDEKSAKDKAKDLSLIAVFWTLGYGLTNLYKQIISKIILNTNVGFEKMSGWSDSSLHDKITAYERPLANLYTRNVVFVLIVLVISVLISYKLGIIKITYTKELILTSLYAIIAGFVPVWIWCFILSNAVGHGFYYQNYMPYIVAIIYLVVCGIKIDKKEI